MFAVARYEKSVIAIDLGGENGETYFGRKKGCCIVIDRNWGWWRGCEVLDQNLLGGGNLLVMAVMWSIGSRE